MFDLDDAVATIDADLRPGNEFRCVAREEDNSALQILGVTHLQERKKIVSIIPLLSPFTCKRKLTLPIGVNASHVCFNSWSCSRIVRVNFVSIYPGLNSRKEIGLILVPELIHNTATHLSVFTRTFFFAHSTAKLEAM